MTLAGLPNARCSDGIFLPGGTEAARPDKSAFPDLRFVKNNRPHSDKGMVSNHGAVQCNLMAYRHTVFNHERAFRALVQTGKVLNVHTFSNSDRGDIAARITEENQMLDRSPIVTSPVMTALSAINAVS